MGVMIGSDPEFSILKGASAENVTLIDARSAMGIQDGCSREVEVGTDGNANIGELRPKPSKNAAEHTENLRNLINQAYGLAKRGGQKYSLFSAGNGMVSDTGGHIHFSGIDDSPRVVKALDYFFSLPFALIEQEKYAKRRRGGSYGNLGAVRQQEPYGFEYRTPASWLLSKPLCLSALSMAKYVVEASEMGSKQYDAINKALKAIDNEYSFNDIQSHFKTCDKKYLKPIVTKHVLPVLALADAETQAQFAPVLRMIKDGESWNEFQDLSIGWALKPEASTFECRVFDVVTRGSGVIELNEQANAAFSTTQNFVPIRVGCIKDGDEAGVTIRLGNDLNDSKDNKRSLGFDMAKLLDKHLGGGKEVSIVVDEDMPENQLDIAYEWRADPAKRAKVIVALNDIRARIKEKLDAKPIKERKPRKAKPLLGVLAPQDEDDEEVEE